MTRQEASGDEGRTKQEAAGDEGRTRNGVVWCGKDENRYALMHDMTFVEELNVTLLLFHWLEFIQYLTSRCNSLPAVLDTILMKLLSSLIQL